MVQCNPSIDTDSELMKLSATMHLLLFFLRQVFVLCIYVIKSVTTITSCWVLQKAMTWTCLINFFLLHCAALLR